MNHSGSAIGGALIALMCTFAAPASAQSAPAPSPSLTPEQQKQADKEKALTKAKEDLDKELKGKKVDSGPAIQFLYFLAQSLQLEVPASVKLVHAIMSKKMPFPDAQGGVEERRRLATDQKTQKYDPKKFLTEYTKWVNDWKPPTPTPAPAPAPGAGK